MEEVVDLWVGAACVLAGVFGHALLQRATGVIHAAIARPPCLFASDALSINPLEQTCRGDFGEEARSSAATLARPPSRSSPSPARSRIINQTPAAACAERGHDDDGLTTHVQSRARCSHSLMSPGFQLGITYSAHVKLRWIADAIKRVIRRQFGEKT